MQLFTLPTRRRAVVPVRKFDGADTWKFFDELEREQAMGKTAHDEQAVASVQ